MSLAYNDSQETYIISPISTVFEIGKCEELLPEYLYLWFLRPEFDRYARYHSWGSARETFSMEDMLRVHIPVPDIETQRHLVEVWKGLDAIKTDNEALASPLMNLCMSYLDKVRKEYTPEEIGAYIRRVDMRNSDNAIKKVMGLSVTKEFREPTAKVNRNELRNYKILAPCQFGFVQTTNNEKCLVVCLSTFNEKIVISSVNEVFEISHTHFLLPRYLHLWFLRREMDRYARFHSWGSAREIFNFEDMKRVRIPIPPIEIQQAIVDIYTCARESREIAVEAGELSKQACPALIRRGTYSIAS